MLLGCDFSCAPHARKQIVVAVGRREGARVHLLSLKGFADLDAWGAWLASRPQWVGAFDFPFGLPRELIEDLDWPRTWPALIAHYAALDRAEVRRCLSAYCADRPPGRKFAHRATDRPAGSSPSMKWVNPPVALMLHAGVPRLLAAGAIFPGLHMPVGGGTRIALEGYPGLLARELIGRRSYKSDTFARQTPEHRQARTELLAALEAGAGRLGVLLVLNEAQRSDLLADAQGDRLDAALCLVQAAWAHARRNSPGPGYGLAEQTDPLEGWIVSA